MATKCFFIDQTNGANILALPSIAINPKPASWLGASTVVSMDAGKAYFISTFSDTWAVSDFIDYRNRNIVGVAVLKDSLADIDQNAAGGSYLIALEIVPGAIFDTYNVLLLDLKSDKVILSVGGEKYTYPLFVTTDGLNVYVCYLASYPTKPYRVVNHYIMNNGTFEFVQTGKTVKNALLDACHAGNGRWYAIDSKNVHLYADWDLQTVIKTWYHGLISAGGVFYNYNHVGVLY